MHSAVVRLEGGKWKDDLPGQLTPEQWLAANTMTFKQGRQTTRREDTKTDNKSKRNKIKPDTMDSELTVILPVNAQSEQHSNYIAPIVFESGVISNERGWDPLKNANSDTEDLVCFMAGQLLGSEHTW